MVLGSDGLFDFFSNDDVVDIVSAFMNDHPGEDPAPYMLEELLQRAADHAGENLLKIKAPKSLGRLRPCEAHLRQAGVYGFVLMCFVGSLATIPLANNMQVAAGDICEWVSFRLKFVGTQNRMACSVGCVQVWCEELISNADR